jgi:hypothetical protein
MGLEPRFRAHVYAWQRCKKRRMCKLYWAFRKYGTECWKLEVLEECASLEESKIREIELIAEYDAIKSGYNMQKGGDSGLAGMKLRKGHKKAISSSRKIWFQTEDGDRWKEELRKKTKGNKYGALRKNTNLSEETKRKISEGNRGKERTDIQREVFSDEMKRRWDSGVYDNRPAMSEETKRKIAIWNVGKKNTERQKRVATEVNQKKWEITFPDGHTEVVINLRKWCLENGLDQGNLSRTHSGNGKSKHKGYWARKLE